MNQKKAFFLIALLACLKLVMAQGYSDKVRTRLHELDKVKNDSAAVDSLELLLKAGNLSAEEIIRTNYRIIVRSNSLQHFARSLQLCGESVVLARDNKLDSLLGASYAISGTTNYYMDRKKEAIAFYKEAISIAQKNHYPLLEASCSHNAGGALVDLLDFENGERFLLNAQNIWGENKVENMHNYLLSSRVLATLYERTRRQDKAEKIYSNLVQQARAIHDTSLLASNLVFYSGMLNGRGKHNEAAAMTAEALEYMRKGNDFHGLIATLVFHARNLADAGRYKEAMGFEKEALVMQKKTFANDLEKQIGEMEVKFKTAEKENRIKLQQAEIEEQKTRSYFITSLFILLIVAGAFVFNRHRLKAKQILQEEKLEQERLRNQGMIIAQEEERRHIAGELHDGLGQVLSAARLNMESAMRKQASGDDSQLVKALQLLDHSFTELRNISHRMMPVQLIRLGLGAAIPDMIAGMNKDDAFSIRYDAVTEIPRFENKIEINIFRMVQEWLNNIIKYAGASEVSIQLSVDEQGGKHWLNLMIEDNGRGFDTALLESGKGNGWYNINSRLNMLGGQIEIDSRPGKGTLFSVFVPLPADIATIKEHEQNQDLFAR